MPLSRPCFALVPLSQIKIGITTDEVDEDLAVAIRFLRSFNLRHAEIRSLWGKYNTEQPLDKIRQARAMLDEHGIRLAILDTAFFKVPLPPETPQGHAALDKEWKVLDAAIERAPLLGTDQLRIFAFTRPQGPRPGADLPARIVELLQEAVRRAKSKSIRLAVENVGGSYVSTAAASVRLLKAISDDTLGLVWDPNNAGASGERSFPRRLPPP